MPCVAGNVSDAASTPYEWRSKCGCRQSTIIIVFRGNEESAQHLLLYLSGGKIYSARCSSHSKRDALYMPKYSSNGMESLYTDTANSINLGHSQSFELVTRFIRFPFEYPDISWENFSVIDTIF